MSKPAIEADRIDAIARAEKAAFDTGKECEHCDGTGRVPGGEKVIHSMAGSFGADWTVEAVVDAIKDADRVAWVDHWNDHDLGIEKDGKVYRFAVPYPEGEVKQ
jgi:hypothetical protein